jgi:hypothetical protein
MKKVIILTTVFVLIAAWCVRYYTLNGTFAIHDQYPLEVYKMHETVEFGDCVSYNVYEQPGYAISLESARIVNSDDYLKELDKTPEDFHYLSPKYLELTLTVSNNGDYPNGLTFYALPVLGENWYTFYDNEITACINPFFNDDFNQGHACAVRKNTSTTIKIAYNLYDYHFRESTYGNLENEKMWLWVTLRPIDKRIEIKF